MNGLLNKTMHIKEQEEPKEELAKRTIALDFDGVVHSYTSGWTRADDIPDPPVEGAKEAIEKLRQDYSVNIFSARAGQPGGMNAIEEWLKKNGIEVDEVSTEKPPAHVYVDDRGITFRGNWPDTISKIKTFKSYLGESVAEEKNVGFMKLKALAEKLHGLAHGHEDRQEYRMFHDLYNELIAALAELPPDIKEQFGWIG
jgi:hypothetical protein